MIVLKTSLIMGKLQLIRRANTVELFIYYKCEPALY